MRNRENFQNNEQASEVSGGNPWADMAETAPPFNADGNFSVHEREKADAREAKKYIADNFLNSLEFSGVSYDEMAGKVVSENGLMAAYMEDRAEIFGVDVMLEANESLSGGMKLTTQEHNSELADRIYADLNDKSRMAKMNAEDGEAMKYDAIGDTLVEIENSAKVDEESGAVQTLDSAARHLILEENQRYLRAIKFNRLTEKDKQQYNLRIALIEEVRGYLRSGEEMLAHERANQGSQRQKNAGDDEFEMTNELEPTGKTPEQIAQEEQEKKQYEDVTRAERMCKYEEDRQRKKQQELDELRRQAMRQAKRKSDDQQRLIENAAKQRELLMEDGQKNEDEDEDEMEIEM